MKKVYIKCSKDKYRWIEAMADTATELARLLGVTPNYVNSAISHKIKTFEVVIIPDDDENEI